MLNIKRNLPEYLIGVLIIIINTVVIYPIMSSSMIHDIRITKLFNYMYYVRMRYLALVIVMTLIGLTLGFTWIQELRSFATVHSLRNTISKKALDKATTRAFRSAIYLVSSVAFIIIVEILAIWYFHVKEVNARLVSLSVKSAVWLLVTLTTSLVACLVQMEIRKGRIGNRAIVSH